MTATQANPVTPRDVADQMIETIAQWIELICDALGHKMELVNLPYELAQPQGVPLGLLREGCVSENRQSPSRVRKSRCNLTQSRESLCNATQSP